MYNNQAVLPEQLGCMRSAQNGCLALRWWAKGSRTPLPLQSGEAFSCRWLANQVPPI